MHTSPKEVIPRHTFILPQNITQCVSSYNLSVHNKKMGSDCQTQEVILGSYRCKILVNQLISCERNLLHGVLLTAPGLVRVPRWTWKNKVGRSWSYCNHHFTFNIDTESRSYCYSGHSVGLLWSGHGSRWPCGAGRRSDKWCCRCHRFFARKAPV